MKIAVTGGAGYCGVPLCEALLAEGHSVTLIDNLMFGAESILHLVSNPNLNIVQRDIRLEDFSYLKGQDVIFHLAGISGHPECEYNAHSAEHINLHATNQIVNALDPSQLFVFPSTTSFYGSAGEVCTELSKPAPLSLYATTKLAAENIVMQRASSISIRWPTIFGVSPHMRASLLVNDLTCKAVQEGVVVLYDSNSRRSFLHVSDLVQGYIFALRNAESMMGGVYNMGSSDLNYTKQEVAKCINNVHPCEIIQADSISKDIRNFTISYDKIEKLGYKAECSLEYGITELVRLYRFYSPHNMVRVI